MLFRSVSISGIGLAGNKVTFDESTKTYTIRHNAAKLNTTLEFYAHGAYIQYIPATVTVALKKSDGTIVDQVRLSAAHYDSGTLSDKIYHPNVVEDETLSLVYEYNGNWVDTGKKVVYEVYYSISDYS